MCDIDKAIEYLVDAVRETDEIMEDCSPRLQADLIEQKKHFIAAIEALREKQARENPKPLSLEQLKARKGKPVYTVLIGENHAEYIGINNAWWDIYVGYSTKSPDRALFRSGHCRMYGDYNKTWQAYTHEPKGV